MQAPSTHRPLFNARSLMLMTALTLGTTGALQAQTSTPPAQSAQPFSSGPHSSPQAGAASEAFDRADTNKDGQLSAQEAARLPAIHQRFKELDTNGSGSLSREEFKKGTQS